MAERGPADRRAHEHGDLSWKWVVGAAVALTGSAVVIHVALAGLLWGFTRVGGTAGQGPAEPAPPKHLYQRAESEAIEAAGRARLRPDGAGRPGIDAAMADLARRGWPAHPAPTEKGKTR